jgi:hypothetical protein
MLELLIGFSAVMMAIGLYMIPTIVAFSRRHRSRPAIACLNVVAGWMVLGWFWALIWALTGNVEE